MTPSAKTVYRCTECGADHPKWAGRCDVCGEWNTLVEETAVPKARAALGGGNARRVGGHESLGAGGTVVETTRIGAGAGAGSAGIGDRFLAAGEHLERFLVDPAE